MVNPEGRFGLVTWIPCLGTTSLPADSRAPTLRRGFPPSPRPSSFRLRLPQRPSLILGPRRSPGLRGQTRPSPGALPRQSPLPRSAPPHPRPRYNPGIPGRRGPNPEAPTPPPPGIPAHSPGQSAGALCQRGSRSARGSSSSTWTRTRLAAAGG